MAGRTLPPTISTLCAQDNFVAYVKSKLFESHMSQNDLAKKIGVERKTINMILEKKQQPKLDIVVRILECFGDTRISIPFTNHLPI